MYSASKLSHSNVPSGGQGHFGEHSGSVVKDTQEAGARTALDLARDSGPESPLLTLPAKQSAETRRNTSLLGIPQESCSGEWEASDGSMVAVPWKSRFGWLSTSISPFRFNGPSTLGLMQLIGL